MENCVFCKILAGKIPSSKIHEDEDTYAFLDIAPANHGHALVITKEHRETLGDIPDAELISLIGSVKKVARSVEEATGCTGYNVFMNNRKDGGQVVPHAHFHIVPRYAGDGLSFTWPAKSYQGNEMRDMQKRLTGSGRG